MIYAQVSYGTVRIRLGQVQSRQHRLLLALARLCSSCYSLVTPGLTGQPELISRSRSIYFEIYASIYQNLYPYLISSGHRRLCRVPLREKVAQLVQYVTFPLQNSDYLGFDSR